MAAVTSKSPGTVTSLYRSPPSSPMSSPDRAQQRPRRLSTASSTSSSTDSEACSSFSSSSSKSLDAYETKQRFFSVQNITMRNRNGDGDVESPNMKFVALPDRTLAHSSPGFLPLELEESELNPKAVPFVPRFSAPAQSSRTPPPQHTQSEFRYDEIDLNNPPPPPGLLHPQQIQPSQQEYEVPAKDSPGAWYPFFMAGLGSTDLPECSMQAEATISSTEMWSNEDFSALASQFCLNAYSNAEDFSDAGAYFASCLLETISNRFEPTVGQTFLWYLRQHALQGFESAWDPSVFYQTAQQSPAHALGAISVVRFIADLYAHGLMTATHVVPCLNRLVAISSTQEHIVAVGYLIIRCGAKLWTPSVNISPEPVHRFLPRFIETARRSHSSLLGREAAHCQQWVEAVTLHITKWEAQGKLRKRLL